MQVMAAFAIAGVILCCAARGEAHDATQDNPAANSARASQRNEELRDRFRLGKLKGRTVLITPDGKRFFAFGVNHVKDIRDTTYFESLSRDGGGAAAWKQILKEYQAWGFNICGYGAPLEAQATLPFVLECTVARTSKFFSEPPAEGSAKAQRSRLSWEFPDVWGEEWRKEAEEAIRAMCKGHEKSERLVGYFWTDTPTWDVIKTRGLRGTDWVSAIRKLKGDTLGKRKYVEFLRERYADRLNDFREFYSLKDFDFDDLPDHDFKNLPIGRHRVIEDDKAFLGVIARQYYSTLSVIQRKHDSRRILFGERFLAGDTPDEVLLAAKDFVDVISIQPGDGYTYLYPPSDRLPGDELDQIHKITGKPVLVCDHQISFPTKDYAQTTWTQLADEATAAAATDRFIREAFAKPYVVGYLRCQYIDRPAGFGRGIKQGVLQESGKPHSLLFDAHLRAGKAIQSKIPE